MAAVAAVVTVVVTGGGPQVGESGRALPASHNPPYSYHTSPPTSGNHLPTRAPYGFSPTPLAPEAVVHNMEHGAVVIWYQPGDVALADQVDDLTRQLGDECLVATPYADMEEVVVATAWGRILRLGIFDAAAITEFADAYRGERGPESNNCRLGI